MLKLYVTNRLFSDNNNHVEFIASETHFSVIIYNANYKKGKEIYDQILEQISNNPKITISELAVVLKTTDKTIRYYMDKLRDKGIVIRHGSTKSGVWEINK